MLKILKSKGNPNQKNSYKEDKLVDPINEVMVKLDNKMKVTKGELAVMINGLDYKRKALLKENQDTPEIDELLLKIIDISEKM